MALFPSLRLTFIFSLFALRLAMDKKDVAALSAFFFKFNKEMAAPMKSLKKDFFAALGAVDVVQTQLRNFKHILKYDAVSFTFLAEYLLRPESGFYYEGILDKEQWISAHVRVVFEPLASATQVDFLGLARRQLGLTMAYQTCNETTVLPDFETVYVSPDTPPSDLVGLHKPSGRRYRENIQGFYEMKMAPLSFKVGGSSQLFLVTLQVSEAYSKSLKEPVSSFYSKAAEQDYLYVLSRLSFMGQSLFGMKVLHGDISLANVGVRLAMVRLNGANVKTLEPLLLLSDSMVNMKANAEAEQDYSDGVLRFEPEYRAPWIEAHAAERDNQSQEVAYSYSFQLKEDGYALYRLIEKFVELNGLGQNAHVKSLFQALEAAFEKGIEAFEDAPDASQIHQIVQSSLKQSGFYSSRLLI